MHGVGNRSVSLVEFLPLKAAAKDFVRTVVVVIIVELTVSDTHGQGHVYAMPKLSTTTRLSLAMITACISLCNVKGN